MLMVSIAYCFQAFLSIKEEDSAGLIALHTGPIELFLVTAYEGNRDIMYFYVTAGAFAGFHAGL